MTQRCAILDAKGVVVNVIVADETYVPGVGFVLQPSAIASVGDTWDGTTFVRPPPRPLSVQQQRDSISAQLSGLDVFIPRGLEDYWIAIGFDTTKLPMEQQSRLKLKVSLRSQLAALKG